jgi:rRNA-processing protein FCF1
MLTEIGMINHAFYTGAELLILMAESINLVFIVTSEFEQDVLAKYVSDHKGASRETTNEHQKAFWLINGISVILYKDNLVVQGRLNEFTRTFLRGLRDVLGLTLDAKNAEKFRAIFPVRQNSVVCGKCGKDSLTILGQIEGLDISFKMECGHSCDLTAPFLTLNNRVLPDINMIVAKSVSRLINLGRLKGAEIVFPEFILDIVDKFKGSGQKTAISEELDNLRKIAGKGSITINTFHNLPFVYQTKTPEDEDKVILDFAHFTNSFLMTSDKVLKERAIMEGRPTIFVSPDDFGKLKMIEEVRT